MFRTIFILFLHCMYFCLIDATDYNYLQFTKQIGTSSNDYSHCVTVSSLGDIYIASTTSASFQGSVYNGGSDVLLLQYNNTGQLIWYKQIGTAVNDAG